VHQGDRFAIAEPQSFQVDDELIFGKL